MASSAVLPEFSNTAKAKLREDKLLLPLVEREGHLRDALTENAHLTAKLDALLKARDSQELPPLEVTPEDIEAGRNYKLPDSLQPDDLDDVIKWWVKLYSWMQGAIMRRETQLRDSLSQNASLVEKVKDLIRYSEHYAGTEDCITNLENLVDKANAEVAKLKDSCRIVYRVDWVDSKGIYSPGSATVSDRALAESFMSKSRKDHLVEIISVERVIDSSEEAA